MKKKFRYRSEIFLSHSDNAEIVKRYNSGQSRPEVVLWHWSTRQNISRIISTYKKLIEAESKLEILPNGNFDGNQPVEHYLAIMSPRLLFCITDLGLNKLTMGKLKDFPVDKLHEHRKFGNRSEDELRDILGRLG